jgi:hypothetical protein
MTGYNLYGCLKIGADQLAEIGGGHPFIDFETFREKSANAAIGD